MAYTLQSFAQLVRQRYPDYGSDDRTAVRRILAEAPEYRSWLDKDTLDDLDRDERIQSNIQAAGPFRSALPKQPSAAEILRDPLLSGAETLLPTREILPANAKAPVRFPSGLGMDMTQAQQAELQHKLPTYQGPGPIPSPVSYMPGIDSQLEQQQKAAKAADLDRKRFLLTESIPEDGGPMGYMKRMLQAAPAVGGAIKGAVHAASGYAPELDPTIAPSEQGGYKTGAMGTTGAAFLGSGLIGSMPTAPSKAIGTAIPAAYQALMEFNQQRRQAAQSPQPLDANRIMLEAAKGGAVGASMAAPLPGKLTGPGAVLGQAVAGAGLNAMPQMAEQLLDKGRIDLNDPELQKWAAIGGGAGAGFGGLQAARAVKSLPKLNIAAGSLGSERGAISPELMNRIGALGTKATVGAIVGAGTAKAYDKDPKIGAALGAVGMPLAYKIGRHAFKQTPKLESEIFSQLSPEVQDALSYVPPARSPREFLQQAAAAIKQSIKTTFTTEGKLKAAGFDDVADEIINLKNKRLEVAPKVFDDFKSVVEPLQTRADMTDFWTLVRLRRYAETGRKGKIIEDGLPLESVEESLALAEQQASPSVLEAARRHKTWAHELGRLRIEGGRLTPNHLLDNPDYFPDYVLDFVNPERPFLGAAAPVGKYRKSGSEKLHKGGERTTLRDYVQTMSRYAAETYENHARDMFVKKIMAKHDAMPRLTAELEQILSPAQMVPAEGTGVFTHIKALAKANQLLPEDHVFFRYNDQFGFVPKVIAQRMLAHTDTSSEALRIAQRVTSRLKGTILRGIWGSFTINNFLGDNWRLLSFDEGWNPLKAADTTYGGPFTGAVTGGAIGALTGAASADQQGEQGWKGALAGGAGGAIFGAMLGKGLGTSGQSAAKAAKLFTSGVDPKSLSPADRALYYTAQLAQEVNIGSGAATSELGASLHNDPKIRMLKGHSSPFGRAVMTIGAGAISKMDMIRGYLETVPRLGEFMLNLERGQAPDKAGRITRKIMIDYSDLSPTEEKWFRGLFIPFYTFYARNLQSLIPGLVTGPDDSFATGAKVAGRAWTRMVGPMMATTLYNNTITPGAEDRLTDNERNQLHINLPWGAGNNDYLYVGFMDPITSAMRMTGTEGLPNRALRVVQDKTTPGREWEASKQQFRESNVGMLTPLVTIPGSLLTGSDWRTGRNIRQPNQSAARNAQTTASYIAQNTPGAFVVGRAATEGEGLTDTVANVAKRFMLGGLVRGKNAEKMQLAGAARAEALGRQQMAQDTAAQKYESAKPLVTKLLQLESKEAEDFINQAIKDSEALRAAEYGQIADENNAQLLAALTFAAEQNQQLQPLRHKFSLYINAPKQPGKRSTYVERELQRLSPMPPRRQ